MSTKIDERLEKSDESRNFTLTEFESAFVKELTVLLQYHVAKDQIVSNLITYMAMSRLGYAHIKDGYNLRYSIDLDKDPATVSIEEVKI